MAEKWLVFYQTDEAYREMTLARLNQAQREYWNEEANRRLQAERIRAHFENNPHAREALSHLAKEQWQDEELLAWRRVKTQEQWTPDFRAKRKAALHQTYYRKTVAVLKQFEVEGAIDLDAYHAHRLAIRDNSLLRFDKFCQRYFNGDIAQACEAVASYNHRVVAVEPLEEELDVYDVEVPHTHNFALASGIFVHNSAKQGRDRHFQAILPLRGKILNVERARLDKMLENQEIKALINAIGTGIGEETDMSKRRYGKIVMLTDADVDGAHIRTLLLTFFFRHMRPLIEGGYVYAAKPPLYSIRFGASEVHYVFSDKERDELITSKGKKPAAPQTRFKGLGEMFVEELWQTTMNPE